MIYTILNTHLLTIRPFKKFMCLDASNRRRQTHTTNKQAATMASLSTATRKH